MVQFGKVTSKYHQISIFEEINYSNYSNYSFQGRNWTWKSAGVDVATSPALLRSVVVPLGSIGSVDFICSEFNSGRKVKFHIIIWKKISYHYHWYMIILTHYWYQELNNSDILRKSQNMENLCFCRKLFLVLSTSFQHAHAVSTPF